MPEQYFGGPYVQVAAVCATPLVEQGGQLSVIRIQDRIQLAGLTDQMRPQPLNSLWLVVCLKSGEMRGQHQITITPHDPTGNALPSTNFPVFLGGDEQGHLIAFPLTVVAEEEGLYWFDITLEQALLTRVPLRVMYQKLMGLPFVPPQAG